MANQCCHVLRRTCGKGTMTTSGQRAFLDMLAVAEGTYGLGDNGYNVLVGKTLFDGYASHPNKLVKINDRLFSTAAGRYQLLYRNWLAYSRLLKLKDFGPESQDAIALQLISEQGALGDIESGNVASAIRKCRNIWASLPGAGYGQREVKLEKLVADFNFFKGANNVS